MVEIQYDDAYVLIDAMKIFSLRIHKKGSKRNVPTLKINMHIITKKQAK